MAAYEIRDYIWVSGPAAKSSASRLKEMGGVWVPRLNGWMFPADFDQQVEEVLKQAPPPTEKEVASADRLTQFKERVEENGGYDIDHMEILDYSDASFIVYGKTFDYKDDLKKMKGKWMAGAKGWVFSNKRRQAVEDFIEEVNREADIRAAEARDSAERTGRVYGRRASGSGSAGPSGAAASRPRRVVVVADRSSPPKAQVVSGIPRVPAATGRVSTSKGRVAFD